MKTFLTLPSLFLAYVSLLVCGFLEDGIMALIILILVICPEFSIESGSQQVLSKAPTYSLLNK